MAKDPARRPSARGLLMELLGEGVTADLGRTQAAVTQVLQRTWAQEAPATAPAGRQVPAPGSAPVGTRPPGSPVTIPTTAPRSTAGSPMARAGRRSTAPARLAGASRRHRARQARRVAAPWPWRR
jgi:hypothetical protein